MNSTNPNNSSEASSNEIIPWGDLTSEECNAKLEAAKTFEEEVAVMVAHGVLPTTAVRALTVGRDVMRRDETE